MHTWTCTLKFESICFKKKWKFPYFRSNIWRQFSFISVQNKRHSLHSWVYSGMRSVFRRNPRRSQLSRRPRRREWKAVYTTIFSMVAAAVGAIMVTMTKTLCDLRFNWLMARWRRCWLSLRLLLDAISCHCSVVFCSSGNRRSKFDHFYVSSFGLRSYIQIKVSLLKLVYEI